MCVQSVCVGVGGVRVCVLVLLVFMGLCVCVYSCVDVFMYVHVNVCVYLYLYRCAYVSIWIDRFYSSYFLFSVVFAWPFFICGVMRLVNSVDERDPSLLNSVKCDSSWITSQRDTATKFDATQHMTHHT